MAPRPVTVIVGVKKPVSDGALNVTVDCTVTPGVQEPESPTFAGKRLMLGAPATAAA